MSISSNRFLYTTFRMLLRVNSETNLVSLSLDLLRFAKLQNRITGYSSIKLDNQDIKKICSMKYLGNCNRPISEVET